MITELHLQLVGLLLLLSLLSANLIYFPVVTVLITSTLLLVLLFYYFSYYRLVSGERLLYQTCEGLLLKPEPLVRMLCLLPLVSLTLLVDL